MTERSDLMNAKGPRFIPEDYPNLPSAKIVSQMAIYQIGSRPDTWGQAIWHSECGTTHCYAGHVDLTMQLFHKDGSAYRVGIKQLISPVREFLDYNDMQWCDITSPVSSLSLLIEIHNKHFNDEIPVGITEDMVQSTREKLREYLSKTIPKVPLPVGNHVSI